jgi:hypothetical protein
MAVPIFSGEFLIAVVVFLCGGNKSDEGALELWAAEKNDSSKISLIDGFYGGLKNIEQSSRNVRFARGQGLPGMIWDYHIPMLISDPANSPLFIRANNAAIDNITTALGFPCRNQKKNHVISFLSSNDTPISKRFEIWLPDKEHKYLFMHGGKCVLDENLSSKSIHKKVRRGDGLKGRVWLTGCPAVSTDLVTDELVQFNIKDEFKVGVVMPIIENGFLNSLIVFLF